MALGRPNLGTEVDALISDGSTVDVLAHGFDDGSDLVSQDAGEQAHWVRALENAKQGDATENFFSSIRSSPLVFLPIARWHRLLLWPGLDRPDAMGGATPVRVRRSRSAAGRMLYASTEVGKSGSLYRAIQVCAILTSIGVYTLSTVDPVIAESTPSCLAEGATSLIFAVDYALHLYACREHRHYAHLGAVSARLYWAVSWEALLDAISFLPFFFDYVVITPGDRSLPSLGWVRVLGIFHLFRTSQWAGAVRTVSRVLFVNREILYTSLALVSLTILLTSILLHAACAENRKLCKQEHGITHLPSAMYVATMMLTGQASLDGELSTALRVVVMLTAFLSVPFFAVPAAMLTWGFEGEAQRLAEREKRRSTRRQAYSDKLPAICDDSTSADILSPKGSDDEYEEYLDGLGGGESDEEEKEAMEDEALAFFRQVASSSAAAAEQSDTRESGLLSKAHALASRLWEREQESLRLRQQRRDALMLLHKLRSDFDEQMSSEDYEATEARLRTFARAVSPPDTVSGPHSSESLRLCADESNEKKATLQENPEAMRRRLDALQSEVAELRHTMLSMTSDIKTSIDLLARSAGLQH
ncbi:MAG: hypothetical protein SGPRY_004966 [Prymnesium sp.]